VTYPFVHTDAVSALFAVAMVLALGKFVAEVFSPLAVLAVFVGSAVFAGLVYSAVPGLRQALIGGFPAVYGLVGALTFIRWVRLGGLGGDGAQAFTLIGMLMGVKLIFGVLFGGSPVWIADLAGFVCGFALSFLVGPGGPARMIRAARQR
jgi:membrane associated rhomboid family serine protease